MLDKVRKPKKAKSVSQFIGWSLLGAICLSFVFVGLTPNTGSNFTGGANAAIVNSEVINLQDFEQAMERNRRQMGDMWNQLPAAQRQMFESRLREKVLNELVNTEILYQKALKTGFRPSKQAIREELVRLPYFQEEGRFSRQRYLSLLEANQLSAASFEDQIRMQLALRQTSLAFASALKPPQFLAQLENQAGAMEAEIQYVEFQPQSLQLSTAVSEKDIEDYLANAENAAKVKTFYDSRLEDYKTPEQVKAQHILIKTGADGLSDDAALKKAKEIRAQADTKNFADLAKKFSEDLGSKDKGGDLGYFSRGRMVPEFEAAAFSLDTGSISEPVKSDFGYHIIYLVDKEASQTRSFDEVKNDIAKDQILQTQKDAVGKEIEAALNSPVQLAQVLKKYNLKWESTGRFGLSNPEIPKLSGLNDAVLASLSAKQSDQPISKVFRSEGKSYLVKPAVIAPKAKAKDVNPDLENGGMEAMNAWALALRESANVQLNSQLLTR